MFSFLNNIPQVTKNILLINVTLYIVSFLSLKIGGINLFELLGAHYVNSTLFRPYQVITHMFMHSQFDIFHIIFNMFILVMFGAHLERIWGNKRFFIFYISCGIGAFALYNVIGAWELHSIKAYLINSGLEIETLNNSIKTGIATKYDIYPVVQFYKNISLSTMAGASGALFGIMAGFAMLFPNTELMLIFFPVPVKAKYLIGGYFVYELFKSFSISGDNVAHLAHVGGAITGAIFILVWRRMDKKNFW